jgi:uncharacterized protein YccT (UPF0319 family)
MQRDRLSEEAPYSEEMRQSELHEKKRMSRGLLCSQCNTAIGLLQDSVVRMQSAIKYIQEHEEYNRNDCI